MNKTEHDEALRKAGEIVNRAMRGAVKFREAPGIDGADIALIAWWLLKYNQAWKDVAPMIVAADDPLEPHPDPMRNRNDGVV